MSEQTDIPKQNSNESINKEEVYYDQRSVALRTPQSIYFVKDHDKVAMLELLMNDYKEMQVVIVVKSKKKADALCKLLTSRDFKVTAVHGNHRESRQQEAAKKFNIGTVQVIISTDMILKTLALENIKLMISYDLPDMGQEYYNRLAYMKELGVALALVSPEDEAFLVDIEFNMKREIEEKTVEGFTETPLPRYKNKTKKDRTKKPRHRKNKVKKDQEEQ